MLKILSRYCILHIIRKINYQILIESTMFLRKYEYYTRVIALIRKKEVKYCTLKTVKIAQSLFALFFHSLISWFFRRHFIWFSFIVSIMQICTISSQSCLLANYRLKCNRKINTFLRIAKYFDVNTFVLNEVIQTSLKFKNMNKHDLFSTT